jgi:hypothetical protein
MAPRNDGENQGNMVDFIAEVRVVCSEVKGLRLDFNRWREEIRAELAQHRAEMHNLEINGCAKAQAHSATAQEVREIQRELDQVKGAGRFLAWASNILAGLFGAVAGYLGSKGVHTP